MKEFGNTRFPTMAKRAVEHGLEPADSIKSEGMSCFARTNLGPTYKHHIEKYGKDFKYEDFIPMWKATTSTPATIFASPFRLTK